MPTSQRTAHNINQISTNVLVTDKPSTMTSWQPHIIVDGDRYSYFRSCAGDRVVMVKIPPSSFLQEDIEAINKLCDRKEAPRNRTVKRALADSLSAYFGQVALQVYEFGCGRFPIVRQFQNRAGLSYHGIERDRNYITELHRMGIMASDWSTAMACSAPEDKPSICVAVYALHFMVSSKLPRRIEHLTNDQGFFAGNFYVDPTERNSHKSRTALSNILGRAGMSFIVIDEPGQPSNQYWVIGRSGNVSAMHRYSEILKETLSGARKLIP